MIWISFSMTIPSDTTVRAIHNDAEDAVVSVQEIDIDWKYWCREHIAAPPLTK